MTTLPLLMIPGPAPVAARMIDAAAAVVGLHA